MQETIDYSIYYKRWRQGTLEELELQSRRMARWLNPILAGHAPTERVLDYGCGSGELIFYLQQKFQDVLGVDISEQQVDAARKHGIPADLISLEDFDGWIDLNAGRFDIVFLFDVLEHVEVAKQIRFMRQIRRLLSPTGTAYVKVPNANSLLAARWRYNDWTHTASFTEASLDFVLANAGLSQIEGLCDESSVLPRYWWVPRPSLRNFYVRTLARKLWRRYLHAELGVQAESLPLGYNIFVRARSQA